MTIQLHVQAHLGLPHLNDPEGKLTDGTAEIYAPFYLHNIIVARLLAATPVAKYYFIQ